MAEDDGAKQKVVSLLKDRDEDLSLIRATLQGTVNASADSIYRDANYFQEQIEGFTGDDAGQKDHKEMLSTLLQFV